MNDVAIESIHSAVIATVERAPVLDSLLTRGDQRRLVRAVRDWYIETYAESVARDGTCVVVTSGPPGAGKSSALGSAVDTGSKLVIDPDIAKEQLARWCVVEGVYGDLLSTVVSDGRPIMPLELSPLLQTLSVETCNATRRTAFDRRMDVVLEATMASPNYGDRLLKSLAKSDYVEMLVISVEVDRDTAHRRARQRWWSGRIENMELGGRLVLPDVIDAAYPPDGAASRCRDNARRLVSEVHSEAGFLRSATLLEFHGSTLTGMSAAPLRAVEG